MSWSVPDKIRLTMLHQLQTSNEPGLIRTRSRETTCEVRRPERGERRVAVECGQCHRQGVFVIQDHETTKRLRRGPVIRSLVAATVLLGAVAAFAIIGFGGGNVLFQVLTLPAALILLPIGLYLAISPSGNIGVESPEFLHFDRETTREGLNYVVRGTKQGQGVACSGHARAAS